MGRVSALSVSGPNTGGKTVLLKALGLLSTLTRPAFRAGRSETVSDLDDAFADVGVPRSIGRAPPLQRAPEESARLATADSLVLIDELGSGTDPVEGAALGWAILEDRPRAVR